MLEHKGNKKYYIPHSPEYEKFVNYILSQKKGKVLDIPSGNLWLTKILIDNQFDCIADDICYKDITEEMKKLNIKYNSSNLNDKLPYDYESFDYIICFEGLEHIANPYVAMKEFHRLLKKKGKAFITIPNTLSITSRIRYLFTGEMSAFPNILEVNKAYKHLHIHQLFISQFNYIISEIGLEINLIEPFGRIRILHLIITSIFIPILVMIQRLKNKKHEVSMVKKILNSRSLLLNKGLFFALRKKEYINDKHCIGDYGKYPSIGIH